MEQMLKTLPALEEHYNSRKDCYYEIRTDAIKGTYLVAPKDIENGEVILMETPIGRQPANPTQSLLQSEVAAPLLEALNRCAQTHGHLTGTDMYPPEARHAMDRLTELNSRDFLLRSHHLKDIWDLQDSHRGSAEEGDVVMIAGLQSEASQKLNGKEGIVRGVDEKAQGRLAVVTEGIRKSLKPANLKTLGGILRTNAYVDNDNRIMLLFQVLSRINHACGEHANVVKICNEEDKAFVIAKKDIRAGEELLIDYISGEPDENRLGMLQMKYNFRCDCPLHE